MTRQINRVPEQAKTPWSKPIVRSVSAGSAEGGATGTDDGAAGLTS